MSRENAGVARRTCPGRGARLLRSPWTVVAAALVTTGFSVTVPFLAEDYPTILAASRSLERDGVSGAVVESFRSGHSPLFYRPVFEVLTVLQVSLFGAVPIGFHVTNVALLIAAALLLRSLAHRLFASDVAAGTAALLFVTSPFVGETVVWVTGKDTLLPVALVLLTVRLALSERPSVRTFGVPLVGGLAAFAKEWAAVVAPVLVVLARRREVGLARALVASALLIVLCVGFVAVRAAVLGDLVGGYARPLPLAEVLVQRLEQLAALLFPLPTRLSGATLGWLAPAAVAALLAAAWWKSRLRGVALSVAWIVAVDLAHLPVGIGRDHFEDVRYVFPAVPALCLLAAGPLARPGVLRRLPAALLLVLHVLGLLVVLPEWREAGRITARIRDAASAVAASEASGVRVIGVPNLVGGARIGFGLHCAFGPPFSAVQRPVELTPELYVAHHGMRRTPEVLELWRASAAPAGRRGVVLHWDREARALRAAAPEHVATAVRGRVVVLPAGGVGLECASLRLSGLPAAATADSVHLLHGTFRRLATGAVVFDVATARRAPPLLRLPSGAAPRVELRGPPHAVWMLFVGGAHPPVAVGGLGVRMVDATTPVETGVLGPDGRHDVPLPRAPAPGTRVQAVYLTPDGRVLFSACACR